METAGHVRRKGRRGIEGEVQSKRGTVRREMKSMVGAEDLEDL